MATDRTLLSRTTAASSAARSSRQDVGPAWETKPTPELLLLTKPRRIDVLRRRVVPVTISLLVISALGVAAIARAEMAKMEIAVQMLQTKITAAESSHTSLVLKEAQLSAPSRIVTFAESRLGMSHATSEQIVAGGSVAGSTKETLVTPADGAPYAAGSQYAPPTTMTTSVASTTVSAPTTTVPPSTTTSTPGTSTTPQTVAGGASG